MFDLRYKILSENRGDVDAYLDTITPKVVELTNSLQSQETYVPHAAWKMFKKYVEDEERRLENNLIKIDYDVDTPELVSAVIDNGPVEKVCEVWVLSAQ